MRKLPPIFTKRGAQSIMNVNDLKLRLSQAGQEHLLQFWDELEEAQQAELYAELQAMNFEELNLFFQKATQGLDQSSQLENVDTRMEPVPREVLGSATRDRDQLQAWESAGAGMRPFALSSAVRRAVLLEPSQRAIRSGTLIPPRPGDLQEETVPPGTGPVLSAHPCVRLGPLLTQLLNHR